ncbi:MAG: transcription antitermination factor NusB [Victivallaceae bacterium]|nr:transcription antitermination factor NusB [Victivallaceae bacterium]
MPEGQIHARRLGRELAMEFFFRCDIAKEPPDLEAWERVYEEISKESHELRENRFARKGKEYAEQLICGLALHCTEMDSLIAERAKNWSFERLSSVDKNIMRVAVYEMLYVDDVPPVVSIDEAVEIAMDYSGEQSGSFINGILNSIKDSLKRPPRERREA